MHPYYARNRAIPPEWRYKIMSVRLERKTLSINRQHYTSDKKLGKGAFGAVYAARRYSDGAPVAIKVISLASQKDSLALQNAESALTEIEMAKRLTRTSRHIIHMYDFDFHQTGLSFIVMELGQQDLEKYLSQRLALEPADRKFIWRQLVDIAGALDSQQIVHRDIKPQNLIIFPGGIVKLGDLGIAKQAFHDKTGPTGTPLYSAPEVTRYKPRVVLTTAADVWSWGAVLYRMTYMQHPHYDPPCYYPLENQRLTSDRYLNDVLRRTLVLSPGKRPTPSWLAKHPYTNT
ncbi:unnamed protein product [Adineta steineri]|uniref:Protein kinase domain-containing protein n=1 Tax=Adineta steineri TaxID=433720 RepID=A0A815CWG1_9BILA|nr:unnamed protein product [Adineta steineri]CAF3718800.1 unnamed protein product [Adineta steineri]